MKATYKNRLLKLAKHLESGKLHHKTFDLNTYHCGTRGCAIGECPKVWPKLWKFTRDIPKYKINTLATGSAMEFFDISGCAFQYLFTPQCYLHVIGKQAKKAVIKRIRDFVQSN